MSTPESHYVDANGLTIHYMETGSGPPLILLHGSFDCTGAMWSHQLPTFAQAFRVLVPDARGHGRTDNHAERITLPLLADDVVAFSQALQLDKPFVCGLSMGGRTTLELGIRYPDFASALIVAAAQAHRPWPPAMTARQRAIGQQAPGEVDPGVLERSDPARVARLEASHAVTRDQWKRLLKALSHVWHEALHPTEAYQRIVAPVQLIVGDRDELVPVEYITELYRSLRDAELAVLPNHGHCSFLQGCHGLFENLALEFLQRHLPPAKAI